MTLALDRRTSKAIAKAIRDNLTDSLTRLAHQHDMTDEATEVRLEDILGVFISDAIWEKWDEARDSIRKRDAIATGTASWISYYEYEDLLGPGDNAEAALQMACAEADTALSELLGLAWIA